MKRPSSMFGSIHGQGTHVPKLPFTGESRVAATALSFQLNKRGTLRSRPPFFFLLLSVRKQTSATYADEHPGAAAERRLSGTSFDRPARGGVARSEAELFIRRMPACGPDQSGGSGRHAHRSVFFPPKASSPRVSRVKKSGGKWMKEVKKEKKGRASRMRPPSG